MIGRRPGVARSLTDRGSATVPVIGAGQTSAVEIIGVSRQFRRARTSPLRPAAVVDALVDVSLSIPRGSRFGIVGESGSGKTTLMRMIAALDRPTAGQILVGGRDIAGLAEKDLRFLRRTLQMVFQDPMASLDPRMKVGSIIAEPLQVLGRSDLRGRVATVLEQVGLPASAAQRYPHQFSGGQRQRISIARAIAPEPEILIADEAVSALDVTIRAQILQLIEDLAAAAELTLIFVSHDLSVIRRVCDQVAVLRDGRVVEQGPTEVIYTAPTQPYTRDLIAAVPTLQRSLALARGRAGSGPGGRVDDGSADAPTGGGG